MSDGLTFPLRGMVRARGAWFLPRLRRASEPPIEMRVCHYKTRLRGLGRLPIGFTIHRYRRTPRAAFRCRSRGVDGPWTAAHGKTVSESLLLSSLYSGTRWVKSA